MYFTKGYGRNSLPVEMNLWSITRNAHEPSDFFARQGNFPQEYFVYSKGN